MTTSSPAKWIPLALLLRPQGRRGELLSEPLSTLDSLFSTGRPVWVVPENSTGPVENATPRTLDEHWFPTGRNAGRVVLKLSGCDSISAAEELAGKQLLIPATDLPQLEEGQFFIGDLLDCQLYDGAALLGTVIDVQFATTPDGRTRLEEAPPLLAIAPEAASEADEPVLVPFVQAWLESVDVDAKRIVMHLPKGLFDTSPDDAGSA